MDYLVTTTANATSSSGSTYIPIPPGNGVGGGYWMGGFWYPYVPQPSPVPYPVPYVVPAPEPTREERLAIETLKLGAKVPKKLRDAALRILGHALQAP